MESLYPLLRSPSISAAVDGIEIQRSRTSFEGSHLAEKSPLMMRADAYDDYYAWLIHRPVINLYPGVDRDGTGSGSVSCSSNAI